MNRKDFRPNNNSSQSISEKDRAIIRGGKKEHEEHPQLTSKQSRLVAKQHLKENPRYYDGYKGEIYDNKTGQYKSLGEGKRYYYTENGRKYDIEITDMSKTTANNNFVEVKDVNTGKKYVVDIGKIDTDTYHTGTEKLKSYNPTARQIIEMEYGTSKNVMTPNVISYGKIDNTTAYELSEGRGMEGQKVYGVSIVKYDDNTNNTQRDYDRSKMFYNKQEAQQYIKNLQEVDNKRSR